VWPWVKIQTNTFAFDVVNSIAYLTIFLPALLLLLGLEGRHIGQDTAQFLAARKLAKGEVAIQKQVRGQAPENEPLPK
jgi:hypothetical protein